jgi:hypothetical protein
MLRKKSTILWLSLLLIGALGLVGLGNSLWSKTHKVAEYGESDTASSNNAEGEEFLPDLSDGNDGPGPLCAYLPPHLFFFLEAQQRKTTSDQLSPAQGQDIPLFLLYCQLQIDQS